MPLKRTGLKLFCPVVMGKVQNADNHNVFYLFYELFFSQMTNVRLIQTERVHADDNFKFDENGREVFVRVENTVGK